MSKHADVEKHISAIQDGFEKRAAANMAIGKALKEITMTRLGSAGSAEEAHSALNAYVEGMLHW